MKDFLRKYNILPAPMEGVMRPALMEVCNDLALSQVWVTPFLRVSESVPKVREIKRFLTPFAPEKHRVILQIMGVDPTKLAETAKRAWDCGIAGIDLNCGCPSRQVVNGGAGAGALRNAEAVARIIEAVREACGDGFFSIKTRLGFEHPSEAENILRLWSNVAQVDMFTLHYRTAREGYLSVPGREDRLRQAMEYLPKDTLIFGNGNIESADEARELCQTLKLDGVMVGRGFWRDPFMLVRHFEPERCGEAATAQDARKVLFQALSALEYSKNWSIGSAIELASLIMGASSPEAESLKKRFSKTRAGA